MSGRIPSFVSTTELAAAARRASASVRVDELGHCWRGVGASILCPHREVDDALGRERDVRGVKSAVGESGAHRGFGAGAAGHLEVHARGDAR